MVATLPIYTLQLTKKYSVYHAKQNQAEKAVEEHLKCQQKFRYYQCIYSSETIPIIQEQYQKDGFCIFQNLFHPDLMTLSKKKISEMVKSLVHHYDPIEDEFADFDLESHRIVRMPRIGKGKHNIHFDPEFSKQHQALYTMIQDARILDLLSIIGEGTCSLRETGLSLTRPRINQYGSLSSGEGMEWHSDGAKGEFTMLLGLDDVTEEMGALRIVPKSHSEYVEGIGHDENVIKQKLEELEERKIDYCYRAGEPIVFDARTLHSVNCNNSNNWRVVLWFIMDCY